MSCGNEHCRYCDVSTASATVDGKLVISGFNVPKNAQSQPKCKSVSTYNPCFAPWKFDSTTFQCKLPPIPNCAKESKDQLSCEECKDEFFYQENIRSCVKCDLPMCDMCERRQTSTGEYTSCLKCDSNYALTKEFTSTPKFPKGD